MMCGLRGTTIIQTIAHEGKIKIPFKVPRKEENVLKKHEDLTNINPVISHTF